VPARGKLGAGRLMAAAYPVRTKFGSGSAMSGLVFAVAKDVSFGAG